MTTQIVLVPGFWLGAWAWDDVAPLLTEQGYDVTALTLPGLAEGDSPGEVTLDDQVAAIAAAFDRDATRRVLVVHSGAAVPGTVVLDRHHDLVDHVVFVDTAPVRDGYAMNADLEGDTFPLSAAWDDEMEGGSMRGLSEEQLATFQQRAVPEPAAALREAAHLSDVARLQVPATVVCTAYTSEEYRSYAEQGMPFLAGLLDHKALEYVDLPTGHWPMWSESAKLAEVIATAAGRVERPLPDP
jgi:pimeloyl-ACP methyl ester carboxylesterase